MKKKEILTFVTTWMDLEGIILSEISQSEKKTNTVWFHLYVKFSEQNELTNKIEPDSQIQRTD